MEARLREELIAASPNSKLTFSRKADFLGHDQKTLRRLFGGEKVDRNTIERIFLRLGIKVEEHHLVLDALPGEPESAPLLSTRSRRFVAIGSVAVVAIGMAFTIPLFGSSPSQTSSWRKDFFTGLERGTEHFHQANYSGARKEFDAILTLANHHQDVACQAESLRMSADVDMAQGRLSQARELYRKALRLREQTGQAATYPALYQAIGAVELNLGNYDEAKVWMRKALDGYVAMNDGSGTAILQRDMGSLCAAQRDFEGALAWFASARAAPERGVNTALLMDVRAQEAMVRLEQGEATQAVQVLEEVLTYWKKEGHPRWIATTQVQLAKARIAAKELPTAVVLLEDSLERYRGLGDAYGMGKAQDILNLVREEVGTSSR